MKHNHNLIKLEESSDSHDNQNEDVKTNKSKLYRISAVDYLKKLDVMLERNGCKKVSYQVKKLF